MARAVDQKSYLSTQFVGEGGESPGGILIDDLVFANATLAQFLEFLELGRF